MTVPKSDNPVVSIIIPVYNQLKYVLACLNSINKAEDTTPIEIILMDDCSPEPGLQQTLEDIDGLIYIRNEKNLRFVKNINKGASLAKGDYLYFLNSDTEVRDHYLESLIDTFNNFENVASVGSKLVYPDGSLQEAGSIIYTNGFGYNYGNLDNPNDYKYNFVRDIVYCSAAALLFDTKIFNKIGRMDEDFSPGYYDDSELQIRAKKMGYRTLYQPESVVIHHEGKTHGVDPNKQMKFSKKIKYKLFPPQTTGLKKFQEINRLKLVEKHKDYMNQILYDQEEPLEVKIFDKTKPRLYFFEDNLPAYDQASGSLRCSKILQLLSEDFHVTFIPRHITFERKYLDVLTQKGVRVLCNANGNHVDQIKFLKENLRFADVLVLSRPEDGAYYFPILQEIIEDQSLTPYMIYDTVDIHFKRLNLQIEFSGFEDSTKNYLVKSRENHRAVETFLMQEADETWVVTDEEKVYVSNSKLSEDVRIVPNIWDPQPTEGIYEDRKDMLFIGSFGHEPNIDAIKFYVEEIVPELRKNDLKVKLHVIGSHPELLPDELKDGEYLELHGFVEDPTSFFNNCLMALYPLRYGAGMKGKVTQALALGLPIVTTEIGAQGHDSADSFMLLAENPKDFVDKIKKYISNKDTWENNREKGIEFLDKNFSSKAMHNIFEDLKNDVLEFRQNKK